LSFIDIRGRLVTVVAAGGASRVESQREAQPFPGSRLWTLDSKSSKTLDSSGLRN